MGGSNACIIYCALPAVLGVITTCNVVQRHTAMFHYHFILTKTNASVSIEGGCVQMAAKAILDDTYRTPPTSTALLSTAHQTYYAMAVVNVWAHFFTRALVRFKYSDCHGYSNRVTGRGVVKYGL